MCVVAIEGTWCCDFHNDNKSSSIIFHPGVAQALRSLSSLLNRKEVKILVPAILGLQKNRRTELSPSFPVIQTSLRQANLAPRPPPSPPSSS